MRVATYLVDPFGRDGKAAEKAILGLPAPTEMAGQEQQKYCSMRLALLIIGLRFFG
jgi:hypothetical protein